MSDKEIEMILWIAKRLVYKYKEDQKILTTVENILKREKEQISKYQQICELNNKNLSIIVDNLNKIKSYNSLPNYQTLHKTISAEDTNRFFETFDIDKLLT